MAEIVDITEAPRKFTPTILKIKTEDETLIDKVGHEFFLDTLDIRKMMVKRRGWYLGIDDDLDKISNGDPNTDAAYQLPPVVSMIGYQYSEVIGSKLYLEFMSDVGEFMNLMPRNEMAREACPRLTRGMNQYLIDNEFWGDEWYRICRGTSRDGTAFSCESWDVRSTIDTTPTSNVIPKFNPETGGYDTVEAFIKSTRKIADRPQSRYIDPLMIGLPRGTRMLNKDANMLMHKELFYRHQLEELEFMGYIGKDAGGKSFRSLTKEQIGDLHTNHLEDPDVQDYFEDLFDMQLNDTLGFKHPHYKFVVDKLWIGTTHKGKVQCIWSINGHIIKKAEWEGGDNIPYTQYNLTALDTSYLGLGVMEIIQDYFKEDNILTRLQLVAARQAGKTLIFVPEQLINKYGVDGINKLAKVSGIIPISQGPNEVALSQQIHSVTLGADTGKDFMQARADVRNQIQQFLNINVLESGQSDVPSALRSRGVIQSYASAGSGPDRMRVSLVGQSLARMYENLKGLVYNLESGPLSVPADSQASKFLNISRQDLNLLPYTYAKPVSAVKPAKEATASVLAQMLPQIAQMSNAPGPQERYNFGQFMDMTLEKLLPADEFQRVKQSKGTGVPMEAMMQDPGTQPNPKDPNKVAG